MGIRFSDRHFVINKKQVAHLALGKIMLDKVLKHIHHYYIKPRKGAPPWWLNLLVLLTSLILVCFIWQPIKVFTVSEPISFAEGKGDSITIVQRSWLSDSSDYTDWMKVKFNQDTYWCKCSLPVCTYRSAGSDRFEGRSLDNAQILLVNYKYCLIVKANIGKISYENSRSVIEKKLKNMAPMQEYFIYKIFLGLFLLVYSMFVYKDK